MKPLPMDREIEKEIRVASFQIKTTLTVLAALIFAFASAVNAAPPERVWVVYKDGGKGAISRVLRSANAEIHYEMDNLNAYVASMPSAAVRGLSRNPNIDYIEADVKRYPLGETVPYGITAVQALEVSDAQAGNRTICIIDSGIDLGHPEFVNQPNIDGTHDSGTGLWSTDENSHGTHVAGTIAAMANGEGVVGVLPNGNIGLHIIKVFGASGWAYSSGLVAALDACERAGANVVSMSLGGSFKSRSEDRAFSESNSRGVLSIAAAGNDGNTRKSYPASYSSVMSVAAVDEANVIASFSQQNDQVEIAGPGVGVKSSVPRGTGSEANVAVGAAFADGQAMEGSPNGTRSGALIDCGLGDVNCAASGGGVCLIARGDISFADKVLACENGGGGAAVIYNNADGALSGTLGGVATNIPSIGVSQADGLALQGSVGQSATVTVGSGDYAFFDGTSMATPHVSAVAGLVWSQFVECTNDQIRAAMNATALDLGAAGRDTAYGNGLVQAKAAVDYLSAGCDGSGGGGGGGGGDTGGGGGPEQCDLLPVGASCSSNDECCSGSCKGKPGRQTCK